MRIFIYRWKHGENINIVRADMSSSVNIDNESKDNSIFGEGLTQSLNDTTLTSETKCHIDFTLSGKKFILSLRYYGSNGFLFVNAIKMYQFKAKDSEIKNYTYCSCP